MLLQLLPLFFMHAYGAERRSNSTGRMQAGYPQPLVLHADANVSETAYLIARPRET